MFEDKNNTKIKEKSNSRTLIRDPVTTWILFDELHVALYNYAKALFDDKIFTISLAPLN